MMEVLQKIYKGRFSWNAAYGGEGERSLGDTPKPPPGAAPLNPASKKPTPAKLQKRSVDFFDRKVKEVSYAAITWNPRRLFDAYTQGSRFYDDTGRPWGRGPQC